MKTRMITAVAALAIIVGFSAMNASAWGWGHGNNNMMGPGLMNGNGATDEESRKFLDETKEIRVQIAADSAELNALMAGQNPDSKRVRELTESIATNQIVMQEKSRAYGWDNGRMHGKPMMNSGYRPCMW
jgi:Spy/CpxP family protein refolding chaperone